MKILMINKFLYPAGGAETYAFKLGEYWKEQGHEVEYFGMFHPDNVVGNQWNLYTGSVDFHKKGMGANLTNPFKLIYSGEAKRKVRKILIEFQPDVMHINNFNYQLTPSILCAVQEYRKQSRKKIRVIYTAHDSQLVCPNHYMYSPGQRHVCEKCLHGSFWNCVSGRCIHNSLLRSGVGTLEAVYWKKRNIYDIIDVIVCPSLFMKEKLDTNPLLAVRTVMLRNFVEPMSADKTGKRDYVLYFGRYSDEKGIRMLLDVCRKLPQIPFVFAGDGPLSNLIEGIPNVKNIGFLSGNELIHLVGGARFSVCPSECHENCPFSVIESLMCGTPVLGSDRGGIPELIKDGKTGWLFPGGNAELLRQRIQTIWRSDEPEAFRAACNKERFDTLEEYGRKIMLLYQGE
ncbi:MAG: glycosyltransferase [Oliverpabstia sp.]